MTGVLVDRKHTGQARTQWPWPEAEDTLGLTCGPPGRAACRHHLPAPPGAGSCRERELRVGPEPCPGRPAPGPDLRGYVLLWPPRSHTLRSLCCHPGSPGQGRGPGQSSHRRLGGTPGAGRAEAQRLQEGTGHRAGSRALALARPQLWCPRRCPPSPRTGRPAPLSQGAMRQGAPPAGQRHQAGTPRPAGRGARPGPVTHGQRARAGRDSARSPGQWPPCSSPTCVTWARAADT